MDNALRGALFGALREADRDDAVHLSVIRGAGTCFSSGYDLGSDLSADRPSYTAGGAGSWARQVTDGWLSLWDLAKPVIAQVHGYAMAGGSELAAACDLVYLADDATISHPVLRVAGTPDFAVHPWLVGLRNAMEMVLTGDAVDAADPYGSATPTGRFPPTSWTTGYWTSPRGSPGCRTSCCSSTSAGCTGPWMPWAHGPRCVPHPTWVGWPATSRPSGRTWKALVAGSATPPPRAVSGTTDRLPAYGADGIVPANQRAGPGRVRRWPTGPWSAGRAWPRRPRPGR